MKDFFEYLKSVLSFFLSLFGIVIISVTVGIVGSLVGDYTGIVLFVLTLSVGFIGAVSHYFFQPGRKPL